MGILGWLSDRFNDETIDDCFVELERKFTEEWIVWAQQNNYSVLGEVPDDILKSTQGSPFIKCDKPKILFPLQKYHGEYEIFSFYVEKEYDSFFSSATHTYNCLVAATRFNLGEGVIESEAESQDLFWGKKCLMHIDSDMKRYSYKINGDPQDLVRDFFNDDMVALFRSFDNVHMSYVNGYLFIITPAPRTITRPREEETHNPLRYDPGIDSILDLKCHTRWNDQGVKWLGKIIDNLERANVENMEDIFL